VKAIITNVRIALGQEETTANIGQGPVARKVKRSLEDPNKTQLR
jgi:hypothetical protein